MPLPPPSVESIEGRLRSGQLDEAQRELHRLIARPIPRTLRAKVAELCRRAALPAKAVGVLHRVVVGTDTHVGNPSVQEAAEYAIALQRCGALNEAIRRLKALSPESFPKVWLFQSYCYFAQWDYGRALEPLRRFTQHPLTLPYDQLVGSVNLVAALVHEGHAGEALSLLGPLIEKARSSGSRRLEGNLHELAAQAHLQGKEWSRTEAALEHALTALGGQDPNALFVRKWRALLDCHRHPAKGEPFLKLREVRGEAAQREDFETVRDCDRQEAVLRHAPDILSSVYFGTPHERFRSRLLAEYGPTALPSSFPWVIRGGKKPAVVDLALEGAVAHPLKAGRLLHRLLLTLCADFYRPPSTVEVHNLLYPEESFHPTSTPLKVAQAVSELRRWLKRERVPLTLTQKGGKYRWEAQGPCTILCPDPALDMGEAAVFGRSLTRQWPQQPFTAQQVAQQYSVSQRQAVYWLQEAVARGEVSRHGEGRATRYAVTTKAHPPQSAAS